MKNFFEDNKGRLVEEESAILDKKGIVDEYSMGSIRVKCANIVGEEHESIGYGRGRYVSADCKNAEDGDIVDALGKLLGEMIIAQGNGGKILCCGIGNPYVACDSLGAKTIERLTKMRPDRLVLTVAMPEGLTGISSSQVIKALVEAKGVETCIIIDSLSAKSNDRIGTTYQFTDSGIVPGSAIGCKNSLNQATLGIPVLAIGVPTVIRAKYLGVIEDKISDVLFAPRDVDVVVESVSDVLSKTIIRAVSGIFGGVTT